MKTFGTAGGGAVAQGGMDAGLHLRRRGFGKRDDEQAIDFTRIGSVADQVCRTVPRASPFCPTRRPPTRAGYGPWS